MQRGTAAAAIFLALAAAAAPASAPGPPDAGAASTAAGRAVVSRLHEALESGGEVAARYRRLAPLVRETHDLDRMARFVLGRHRGGLDEGERQRFLDAFERHSIMSYAARFAALQPGALEVTGAEPGAGNAAGRMSVLATLTTAEGEELPMRYVLEEGDAGWRIVNIVVNGVSDLAVRRVQYGRLLEREGFEALLAELESAIDELSATD